MRSQKMQMPMPTHLVRPFMGRHEGLYRHWVSVELTQHISTNPPVVGASVCRHVLQPPLGFGEMHPVQHGMA